MNNIDDGDGYWMTRNNWILHHCLLLLNAIKNSLPFSFIHHFVNIQVQLWIKLSPFFFLFSFFLASSLLLVLYLFTISYFTPKSPWHPAQDDASWSFWSKSENVKLNVSQYISLNHKLMFGCTLYKPFLVFLQFIPSISSTISWV